MLESALEATHVQRKAETCSDWSGVVPGTSGIPTYTNTLPALVLCPS